MSGRAQAHRCERCQRPTPKKRLTATAVGRLCPKCIEHLPRSLRKTTNRVGEDKEKDK